MSGSAVPFSVIPSNIRVPLFYAEFNNTEANSAVFPQRALIVGQSVNSVPATPVPTYMPSTAWADNAYGAGSQIAIMARAYRANDPVGELWLLPLPDAGGGTAATGTVTFTGPATGNGTIFLRVGALSSQTLVAVGVASGQTATNIATAVAAAVNAAYGLPVTATSSSGVVTLTAQNKGLLGNLIPVSLNYLGAKGGESLPAGVTASLPLLLTGGATDPAVASIATWLGSAPFDFIVNPYCNQTALGYTSAMLSDSAGRWSYASQVFGHAFSALYDTVTDQLALGTALNDQHLTVLAVNNHSPTPGWVWLAAFVGAIVPSLKNQPNQPLQTLRIAGVLPEATGQDIGFANQQALLSGGIAVAQRGPGGTAQVVRAVTTYQLNSYGQPDISYLDTETMFTLMLVIRTLKSAITSQIPRALLADDGTMLAPTPPGASPVIVTPSIVRAMLIAIYGGMADENLVEDESTFAAGLVVQRNANDPSRLDVLYDPYLVSGLRIFAVLTEFHLQAQQQAA